MPRACGQPHAGAFGVMQRELDAFETQYIATALWASCGDDDKPLDESHTIADIAPATLTEMLDDCAKFRAANVEILSRYSDEGAGHDFWLTRNHHGAGYWDGDYAEADGDALTKAAHAFGEVWLTVGDDGMIHGG